MYYTEEGCTQAYYSKVGMSKVYDKCLFLAQRRQAKMHRNCTNVGIGAGVGGYIVGKQR